MSDSLYLIPNGLGDALMATGVAENYFLETGRPLHVIHGHPELFAGNQHVVCHSEFAGLKHDKKLLSEAHAQGFRVYGLTYEITVHSPCGTHWTYLPHQSLIGFMCEQIGLKNAVIRPWLHLSEEEKNFGKFNEHLQIAVMSEGQGRYKLWGADKMQSVVNAFPEVHFVQIGSARDALLKGVQDLRGKLSFRQIAGVLHNSRLFIGEVGFFMHLARAVDTPGLVLCPYAEDGDVLYYREFYNMAPPGKCTLCFDEKTSPYACDFQEHCLEALTPEMVIEKLREILKHKRESLTPASLQLSPSNALPLQEITFQHYEKIHKDSHFRSFMLYQTRANRVLHTKPNRFSIIPMPHTIRKKMVRLESDAPFRALFWYKMPHFSISLEEITFAGNDGHVIQSARGIEVLSLCKLVGTRQFVTQSGKTILHSSQFSTGILMFLPIIREATSMTIAFTLHYDQDIAKEFPPELAPKYLAVSGRTAHSLTEKLGFSLLKIRY